MHQHSRVEAWFYANGQLEMKRHKSTARRVASPNALLQLMFKYMWDLHEGIAWVRDMLEVESGALGQGSARFMACIWGCRLEFFGNRVK